MIKLPGEVNFKIRCFKCGHLWSRAEAGNRRLCPECGEQFIEAKITGYK